jgi:hypothetical protein
VQNTSEKVSHYLPYAAKNCEASEILDVYEARSNKASERKICMKPTKHEASEKERAPKAVYKQLEIGEKKKDEARSEEAA